MPYYVKQLPNGKWGKFKKEDNKLVSHHDTKQKAEASIRAYYANKNENIEKTTTTIIVKKDKYPGELIIRNDQIDNFLTGKDVIAHDRNYDEIWVNKNDSAIDIIKNISSKNEGVEKKSKHFDLLIDFSQWLKKNKLERGNTSNNGGDLYVLFPGYSYNNRDAKTKVGTFIYNKDRTVDVFIKEKYGKNINERVGNRRRMVIWPDGFGGKQKEYVFKFSEIPIEKHFNFGNKNYVKEDETHAHDAGMNYISFKPNNVVTVPITVDWLKEKIGEHKMNKLKLDRIIESTVNKRLKDKLLTERFLKEKEEPEPVKEYSSSEKKEFLKAIGSFTSFGESLRDDVDLKGMIEDIKTISTMAADLMKAETQNKEDSWMDSVTISKNVKTLQSNIELFMKTAKELSILKHRLMNTYDEVGTILNKYFDVN